ncbi:MAG: bacteriophage Gp15 family protein [Clostridiales bacterium]|nr:bacteriophage Gp15 family protein [Clostridiales bacterium]
MNLLLDRPPTQIEVGGLFYEIDADFRTGIAFELLMLDEEFTETEKAARAMELYFPQIPDDEEEAMEKILWFYLCGREETNQEEKETEPAPKNIVYSYEYDAGSIYAAFLSQYGMDLVEIPFLHWWKFKALFHALDENLEFMKIMRYRAVDITKVPKEQKDFYRKMKQLYALPDNRTEEEKEQDFISSLSEGL